MALARRTGRRFTAGHIAQGFGVLLQDKGDLPRGERERLAGEIEAACREGRVPAELGALAVQISAALNAQEYLLPAMRTHLQTDGSMIERMVARVASAVPELRPLLNWL